MTSGRYPTVEEARKTFSPGELDSETDKRYDEAHSVEIVRFETYTNKDLRFDPAVLNEIARLISVLPYDCYFEGSSIIRRETHSEAQEKVIGSRRSEMHYTEESPFYAVHMKDSSNE